jgi:carboxyl-terminal processing protease
MFFNFFKEKKVKGIILLVLIVIFFVFEIKGKIFFAETEDPYENLKIFSDVLAILQRSYVEEVDTKKLIYGSISGMLEVLDPHSTFMPPDIYKEMQVETKGTFGGIGIEITIKRGILTIISPIEGTPAYRAGIKAGDIIIRINNDYTKNITLMEAVKKMRGTPGTQVIITIFRKGLKEPKDITIIREIIEIVSIKSKIIEDRFGYIKINQFQEKTGKDFKKILKKMEKENQIQGLVLDLRNNPGGLLDQAVIIADEFIDSGLIVYTKGRREDQEMRFEAHRNDNPHKFSIVVIVNGGSASGAEIVAGALQDHKSALILGTPTFGKASVQTLIPLEDGSGLRLTTARYYTPNGRSIQAKGIIPDVEVSDDYVYIKNAEKKYFMKEKDLSHHLDEKLDDIEMLFDKEEEKSLKETEEKQDIPLERAIEILKSWQIFKKNLK